MQNYCFRGQFIHIGRPIFFFNHSGAAVFTIPIHELHPRSVHDTLPCHLLGFQNTGVPLQQQGNLCDYIQKADT